MKNIFLCGGIIAVAMNSLAGIVLSSFSTYNWIILLMGGLLFIEVFIFIFGVVLRKK